MTPGEAERVAWLAHTAIGQMRADGVTPYIEHPRRVAFLAGLFLKSYEPELIAANAGEPINRNDVIVAAFLHDVVEDTRLTLDQLVFPLGLSYEQRDYVDRMTKKPSANKTKEEIAFDNEVYYQRISESVPTLIIKAADRCANLESVIVDLVVPVPTEPRRWGRYVDDTVSEVLPMYSTLPGLRAELCSRLEAIRRVLPGALERRAAEVERLRANAVGLTVRVRKAASHAVGLA